MTAAGRRSPVPRAVVPLAVLLALALVVLWLTRGSGGRGDLTVGGPLFSVDMKLVDRIHLTSEGVPYRFERREGSLWILSGAVADWVDPQRMGRQLAALAAAEGGRLLPGTEPEDRRFGFNAEGALQVTLFTEEGSEERLALGTRNPVSGHVYASGAGREACFPVLAETRDLLAGLPSAVRVPTLLPMVTLADLDTVTVDRSGRIDVLVRHGGRWWLRVPVWDAPFLPQPVRDYQRLYRDRRREDAGGRWVLADDRAVELLVYDAGRSAITEFVPPAEAAAALARWELDAPARLVTFSGRNLDPDPTGPDPHRLTVGFGPALDPRTVPAVRRGNPVLTGERTLEAIDAPRGDLVHAFALTERPLLADEIELATAAGPLLKVRRTDREFRNDERTQWDQALPAPDSDARRPHLVARNFVVDLDRLRVLAALPPTDSKRILRNDGRVSVTVRRYDPPRTEVWEAGYLDPDHVPGGAEILAPVEPGTEPAGLWRPADGRLLQVPATLLTTARSLAR